MQEEEKPQSSTQAADKTWEEDFPEQKPIASTGILDFIEGVLLRVALIGLVIVVLGQSIMGQDITSVFMSYADRLTTGRIEPQRPVVRDSTSPGVSDKALITFQLVSQPTAPQLKVFRNGVRVGDFESDQVTVTAYAGDVVELDGTGAAGSLLVRVILVAGSISLPAEGSEYVVDGNRVTVAQVR